MSHTRRCLVFFAIAAMGMLALAFPGCRKDEAKDAPASSSPESYVNDPVFRKALADKRRERTGYLVARTKLVRALEKMVEAKKAEMPGASDEAVKAALEKDSEWLDLAKRVSDLTTAVEENSRQAQGIVRERLAPRKEISK